MINKLKIGFLIAVLSLLGVASSANAGALNWSAAQNVTLTSGGEVDLTISSGSEATSLVIGESSLAVVLATTDIFTVTSEDRTFIVSGNTVNTTVSNTNCTVGGTSTLALTSVTGGETITITVNTGSCAPSESEGGGGGSSGGGSRRNNDNDTVATTTDEGCVSGNTFSTTTGRVCTTTTVVAGCGSGNAFSPVTGQACGSSGSTTVIITNPGSGSSGNFGYAFGTLTIRRGTTGPECMAWQRFLNQHRNSGLVVDGNCGPLTMAAAVAWQASQGLVADGLLGPASRARANVQAGTQ